MCARSYSSYLRSTSPSISWYIIYNYLLNKLISITYVSYLISRTKNLIGRVFFDAYCLSLFLSASPCLQVESSSLICLSVFSLTVYCSPECIIKLLRSFLKDFFSVYDESRISPSSSSKFIMIPSSSYLGYSNSLMFLFSLKNCGLSWITFAAMGWMDFFLVKRLSLKSS